MIRWRAAFLGFLVLFALAVSLNGCRSAGTGAYQAISRGATSIDQAVTSYDDLARRTGVSVQEIATPTLASKIFALRFRVATFAPRLTREHADLLKEGGCAMLDYWATFGTGPTDATIKTWMVLQGLDQVSHPAVVIRRKLTNISLMPYEVQDAGQLRKRRIAEVIGLVCLVPLR